MVIVDVKSKLHGEGTSIHWHGMHQRGNPYMDGVTSLTQCAIPSHSDFQYRSVPPPPSLSLCSSLHPMEGVTSLTFGNRGS